MAAAERPRCGSARGARRCTRPRQAAEFARAIVARPGFSLVGLMAYEAQIAGVGDAPPGAAAARRWRSAGCRPARARELAAGAAAVVDAVRAVADLEFVNGGGTGSLERTSRESAVTEVAAGSGLYGPALFDAYRSFTPRPAALFALPVVRRPGAGVATRARRRLPRVGRGGRRPAARARTCRAG